MPPEKKLTETEIADISKWVEMGLPWPKSAEIAKPLGAEERAVEAGGKFIVVAAERPSSGDSRHQQGGMVEYAGRSFILAKLDSVNFALPEVDRRTLIRRASFGSARPAADAGGGGDSVKLTLRPMPMRQLVDRLLASPVLASGGAGTGWMWPATAIRRVTPSCRSGSIRSLHLSRLRHRRFQRGFPYDRFIVEQLAADKLPLGEDKTPLAAMGFLTTGRKFNNHHDDIDDQIDVVSRGTSGNDCGLRPLSRP